ncbi:armadillo-type protein [Coprinopsis sp. MPI-PUGE-AT-0042]|nr:armadillo-type protein [Coprinopsis sp. MPI-PUGE-AT-0042]
MDIPFSSSGALSRAHYGIVRKVETASSPQNADQMLALEVKATHERLSQRSLKTKECKECLVILIYCAATVTPGFLEPDAFEFGLMHALNLAAAGRSIEDKRIGYLYCAELMHSEHELRLMMVNTIRKDLESGVVGKMCLALDTLITMVDENIVPAVRDVLQDLLSHSHASVRRRAIMALRSLSTFDPQLLTQNSRVIVKRLRDRDESVVNAALIASSSIGSSDPTFSKLRQIVNGGMSSIEPSLEMLPSTSLAILQSLQVLGMGEENVSFALDLVRSSVTARQPALTLGVFRLLAQQPSARIIDAEKKFGLCLVRCIQDYLTSYSLNYQYAYLACLLCLDPDVWAGTSTEHPIALEAWEVEKIMQYLDSPDNLLRRMTITLVAKIDPAIITAYLSRCLESLKGGLEIPILNSFAVRLLDVVEVITADDGEKYGQGVKDLLIRLSADGIMDRPRVLEGVVERVLLHTRESSHSFCAACATTLLACLVDLVTDTSPTLLIICSALTVECIGSTSVSPGELLNAFCSVLEVSSPVVQDACLLTVLRLLVEVDEAQVKPALEAVTHLKGKAGKYIRKRCEQVIELGSDPALLRSKVRSAHTSTLPDFLKALERPTQPVTEATQSLSASTAGSAKLRYTAYETPEPIARLREQRSSSGRSGRPATKHLERQRSSDSVEAVNLSLAAVSLGVDMVADATNRSTEEPARPIEPARPDLISLDSPSPFVSEDGQGLSLSEEFQERWTKVGDGHDARGWCNASVTAAVRRLQQSNGARLKLLAGDMPPFIGEVKVVLESVESKAMALLRIREDEDDSCLWRLRTQDRDLRNVVKGCLSDDE